MTINGADPVVSALAQLTVPAPAGLQDGVFTGSLAAPSRLGEVYVAFTGAGMQFVRSAESLHGTRPRSPTPTVAGSPAHCAWTRTGCRTSRTVPARKPSPLLAPCHRVVGADGGTGAHMFGPARREELLRGEDANLDEVATYARRRMRYLGGGPTGVVCLPTCHDARRITPAHRRGFRTPGAALAPGHRPCRTCRPVLGTAA